MMQTLPPRAGYSRAELVSDGVVHVAGLIAALLAVPVLIWRATGLEGVAGAMLAVSVYGATLIAMILCSALYNMVRRAAWEPLLRRLDHSAIYFKIAGTYTPFTVLTGGHWLYLLAALWTAALTGTGLRVFAQERTRRVAICLYLAMGWIGALAAWRLFAQMPRDVVALVVVGGLLYTVGFVFYSMKRLPFHNTIWHVFVLTASAAFFVAIDAFVADVGARVLATGADVAAAALS